MTRDRADRGIVPGGEAPPLALGECLGRGGEATIFALASNPAHVVKLYHQPRPDRTAKLTAMIARPPHPLQVGAHTVIAWPLRALVAPDGSGRLTGCVMPRVTGGTRAAELHNMKSRLVVSPHFTWQYLVRAATNLCAAVQHVHDAGYVIGDVNDQGVLISDHALASLVDCDSFQVTDARTGRVFRCPVGTGAYTPPELSGCRFADVDRTAAHDRFGLGVLIYQFLMGCHPFQTVREEDDEPMALEDAIARGRYADADGGAERAPVSPALDVLPPNTRHLFRLALNGRPEERPTASAWARELWTLDRSLCRCGTNANHWFSRHRVACPWCERTSELGGRDPFPSPEAIAAGDHLRRPAAPQYSWASPRPRAHYDRRRRPPSAASPSPRPLPRTWRPRSRGRT
jgi:DNA-binding helix-hairpin-helix protein with protein kinase domain